MIPSIGVVGENGSGKSYFVSCVFRKHTIYKIFSFGELWNQYAREIGLIGKNESLPSRLKAKVAREALATYGDDYATRRMEAKIDPNEKYLVDGIRQRLTVERLRAIFGKSVVFVSIAASPEARYERLKKRDGYSRKMFEEEEEIDGRFNLNELMARCDYNIVNESDEIALFEKEIETLLKALG